MSNESDDRQKLVEVWQFVALSSALEFFREHPKFGRCSRCRQPATGLIDFAGLLWAICDLCRLKWYTGVTLESEDDPIRQETNLEALLHYESAPRDYDPAGWPDSLVMTTTDDAPSMTGAEKDAAMKDPEILSDSNHIVRVGTQEFLHRIPSENLQVILHAQKREREEREQKAATAGMGYQPTDVEQQQWTISLAAEMHDREARARRDSLADWYVGAYGRYTFTVFFRERLEGPPIEGYKLSGATCAQLLRAGAPILFFHRARSSGEFLKRWATE